ncbi:MAG: outer membrane protein assembly factor BamD [Pseudobdellovibrionaceae bacterium]|nr:outer membrane protein assembly factor BamD [Bdellovibrionales bacterium]USN46913.1 MAG: outer membrane protein assembly factor BamD [Pseudobdellovibrionaceae bacterium]
MKFLNLAIFPIAFLLLGIVALPSCSSTEKIDVASAEGAYQLAKKYEGDERYEEALIQYAEVKNKHPYSRFATLSELATADIHFKREAFIESESAYRLFKEFHPEHEQIDFVTFRLGLSIFKQLPSTIDRDLSLAGRAMLYFDEVVSSYAQSQWAKEAQDYKQKTLVMLAEKEKYIADFYFIRDQYDSALSRYEQLLTLYSGLGLDAKALYGATVSAFKTEQKDKTEKYLDELKKRYPDSPEYARAKKEVTRGL